MKVFSSFAYLFLSLISSCIWWFLLHSILTILNVDRLLWFLFWIYVPIGFVNLCIGIVINYLSEKK